VLQQIRYREARVLKDSKDLVFERTSFINIHEIRMLNFKKRERLFHYRLFAFRLSLTRVTKDPDGPEFRPAIAKDERGT
jgi:hypothetical protein